MRKSKVFRWTSLFLLLLLSACEEDEPKIWDVYFEVVRQTGGSGEYRVEHSGNRGTTINSGGLVDSFWESEVYQVEESKTVFLDFERLQGLGDYRIRIYVGGSFVAEEEVPVQIDNERISYQIPD